MCRIAFILAVALVWIASSVQGAFTLVENFNGLAPGSVNGQHGWTGSGTSDGRVVADPASATNKVLAVTNTTGNVYLALGALSLSNANTGTLYFRLYWPGSPWHAYIGLTDVATPAGNGSTSDYETQVGFDTTDSSLLKVRDATAYRSLASLQSNTWYRVWMVHNNSRDLYAVYIQGGAWPNPVQLSDTSAQTWFTFRNTSGDNFNTNTAPQANPLITFAIKSGSSHVGPLFLDDVYVDPTNVNLAIPEPVPVDTNGPGITAVTPSPGATVPALTALSVTFNEPVMNVTASNLLVNGTFPTAVTGAGATWTWQFPQPPTGTVTVAWAANQTITDLASNQFLPTINAWNYTLLPPDALAPVVASVSPAPGTTVSTLTRIAVTFSEPVLGVQPDDFLVNDVPGLAVTAAGNTYTFTVVPPPQGPVNARFDPAHAITDLAGNRLDETAPANRWSYTRVDTTPPALAQVTPVPGATLTRLEAVELLFTEPVAGVEAADLLVNGSPATSVTGTGLGPYVFAFPPPAAGPVQFSWAAGQGIHDLSPQTNAFAATNWSNSLVATNAVGQVLINEFLTANISAGGLTDEDGALSDWIELFNPGSTPVNLAGWSLTDDPGALSKWVFPSQTLSPGQYLVVFASGKDRRPAGTGQLHTSFTLGPYGDYLALCPPEFPRSAAVEFSPKYPEQRNDYSYGLNPAGQWRYFAAPTPGGPNGDSAVTNALAPVHFSTGRALFNAPFQLVLVPPVPDATIRFTTDGSLPTESNGELYTGPLTLSATTVLRAGAFRPDTLPSRVATATYVFPDQVAQQSDYPPGFPITYSWSQYGWMSQYGMAAPVVNDPRYAADLPRALQALPSLSIVMNVEDIFGDANGIYTHSQTYGPLWERPCSVELIQPDGSAGFQVDAGIQMHGGGSRARTQKHPFRIQFKGKYGPTKLQFPFFPDSPVQEFDTIDLRSEYNDHWTHGFEAAQRARGTLIRDAWCKDVHAAMGDLAGHSRYVHLYINGLYWGVYNPCERPDASFGAAYLGGQPEDYDAYNGTGTQLANGTPDAHNAMLAISNLQLLSQYELMKQYLDVTAYADYMLLLFYGANQDWGVSKNWYCLRQRSPGAGFKYLCWDDERVMEGVNQLPMGVSSVASLNSISPDNLQAKLVASPEYRLLFADRLQKHLLNGGALSAGALQAAWQTRAAQLDLAIIGESARWGAMMTTAGQPGTASLSPLPYPNYTIGAPYTRDVDWLGAQSWLLNSYFPARAAVLLTQLRTVGLYPTNVMAPNFNQYGGRAPAGFALTMSATNAVYFTTNGTDPRVYGSGAIAASARRYTNGLPLTLNGSTLVKARGLQGTNWSALVEATFTIEERVSPLRLVELMYNPVGGSTYEYLELLNSGATPVDLGGYSFEGIKFTFPPSTLLNGSERLLLANNGNPTQWAARYPGVTAAGWYAGNLDNAGERLALLNPLGQTVLSVTYSPTNGWPIRANGGGYSLELCDLNGDPNDPANWRASSAPNGTPGQPPGLLPAPSVVLNEVMAWNLNGVNHAGTFPDWLELFNAGPTSVNLAGWSLSDDGNPRKYVFPATNLPAGSFLVVWCDAATNTTPGLHAGFALNKAGSDLFLYDPATNRIDAVGFGPQVADYSIGQFGSGWQLTRPTPGSANQAATTAAATNLVLNEWLANASPGHDDWLELFNRASTAPVALRGVTLATTNAIYQLRSLSFIPPRGWLQLAADKNPGPVHLDFKLPGEGGALFLYDETGALVDQVTYGSQVEDTSEGRLPDGSTTITNFVFSASPGASNYLVAYPGAMLNEVCALNRTILTNAAGHTPDWVELYNPASSAFALTGFALGRSANFANAWKFPSGASIPAGGLLLICFDNDRPASTNLQSELNTGLALSGAGDALYLFNAQGLVVDAVTFGPQAPDWSIGRAGGAWCLLANPTPGAPNSPPAPLGEPTTLRLNEWLAAPAPGQEEFFELFNPNPLPVALGGLFVTDDLSISGLTQFQIPPLTFIAPAGFTGFIADSQPSAGPDHVNFRLGAQGESLRLCTASGTIIETVVFGAQALGISEGRFPDGADQVTAFTCPTLGSSNGVSTLHFDVQPQNQTASAGGSAQFYANGSGFGLLSYQWFHDHLPLLNATNRTMTLTALQPADAGPYWVLLSNACGSITSSVATLTIAAPLQLGLAKAGLGGFEFTVSGPLGAQYDIETSTNLVQWSVRETVTTTNGSVTVRDPVSADAPALFYRARLRP